MTKNTELQWTLDDLCKGKEPEEILTKFEAAGWYSKKFTHMGVIAVNPLYDDFTLGLCQQWLQATRKPIRDVESGEAWLLWVYPTEQLIEVLA